MRPLVWWVSTSWLICGVACADGERAGDTLGPQDGQDGVVGNDVDSVHEVEDPDGESADAPAELGDADDGELETEQPDVPDVPDMADTPDTFDTSDLADVADTAEVADPDTDPDTGPDEVADATTDTTSDTSPDTDTTPDPYAGLADEALRAVLRAEATLGHTPLGYNGGRDAMYAVGGLDDVGGRIECIYTGRTVDATGSRTPNRNCRKADGTPITCSFNTEHTWARYYLRAALTEGTVAYNAAEGDIHHLRPSDDDVNNARWHFDFGVTDCPEGGACKVSEGSELGQREGVTGQANCPTGNLTLSHVCVMEVRPARAGDIARGMFYMATRYGMAMDDTMEDVLREWSRSDPPDAREAARNDGTESAQGNRNVFVDRPDLIDRIADF